MINFIVCDDEKEIVEKVKIILMKIAFQANIEYKIHAFNSYDESFMQTMNSNLENKIKRERLEKYNYNLNSTL